MIATKPWSLFHWKTAALPKPLRLAHAFSIRTAFSDEKETATHVALLSLKMNTEWHEAHHTVTYAISEGSKRAFVDHDTTSCLVITHGKRIIGASMLDIRPEASYHLLSGPWVLAEYRNRGLGSALLYASIEQLAKEGIEEVAGITFSHSIAARFVYPKFSGMKIFVAPPHFSS